MTAPATRGSVVLMRGRWKTVILAIVALLTTGLRAPSLSLIDAGQDSDEQVTAYRATAPPVLSPARHGRSLESARKTPLLAVLPSCPALSLSLAFYCTLVPFAEQRGSQRALPRTSRGPPVFT